MKNKNKNVFDATELLVDARANQLRHEFKPKKQTENDMQDIDQDGLKQVWTPSESENEESKQLIK